MIYIVWGPPGCGKSYFATSWAVKELIKGKKKVITNYPVIYKNKSSYIWKPDYVYEAISDSIVIQDEAYQEVSSREWKNFDKDKQTFYATNRHNGNTLIVIGQSPARIDVIIREMCNEFLQVKKRTIPFTDFVLWFTVLGAAEEKHIGVKDLISSQQYLRFKRSVAQAYDTHYFKTDKEPPVMERWNSVLDKPKNSKIKIVYDVKGNIKKLNDRLHVNYDDLINKLK